MSNPFFKNTGPYDINDIFQLIDFKIQKLPKKKINDIKQQIVERIKQNSLSNLEKQLRKNKSIKISDFKKVVQEINN